MKVLVLHAYSAENAGDGLLVDETLDLVRSSLGDDAEITLLASRPETFVGRGLTVVPSVPTRRGYDRRYLRLLRQIDGFDLAVAVGGGYLRAGTVLESLKTAVVHGPQLRAAARSTTPTIYLPQSIGPARFGTARPLKRMLSRVDSVMLRDDRSVGEFPLPGGLRVPDLATHTILGGRQASVVPAIRPVLSVRAVRGKVPGGVHELAELLGEYDGYLQSTTGGNDDRAAAATLKPMETIPRGVLMTQGGEPRVVVAVRLHAALMALAAGHLVIHLAYERKGFGAFEDLGLLPWVHNVNSFDVDHVARQVADLRSDTAIRDDYEQQIVGSGPRLQDARRMIVETIRAAVRQTRPVRSKA